MAKKRELQRVPWCGKK